MHSGAAIATRSRRSTSTTSTTSPRSFPPQIDRNAPLVAIDTLRDTVLLTGDAAPLGHFYVELANGVRYVDAHFAAGATARIALPAGARAFVRTDTRKQRSPAMATSRSIASRSIRSACGRAAASTSRT